MLGGLDDRSMDTMAPPTSRSRGVPRNPYQPATAEMIKYASNTLLATMISLSNELANLATGVGGIDIAAVMKGVHLSRYLTTEAGQGEPTTAQLASFLVSGVRVWRKLPSERHEGTDFKRIGIGRADAGP